MRYGLTSRIAEIRAAAEALRSGRAVPSGVAVPLANCLEALLRGSEADLAKQLDIRPRRGGRYETAAVLTKHQARDASIQQLAAAIPATHPAGRDKKERADAVVAILRGEAAPPESAADVLRELRERHGENLPTSARQVVRILRGEAVHHLRLDSETMTSNQDLMSLRKRAVLWNL